MADPDGIITETRWKMKVIRKALDCVINLLIAVIVILALGFMLLKIFGIKPYIVFSGSMEPEIMTGSMIFVDTKIAQEQIHESDIISYELSGETVTHRVIEETVSTVITKGDANDVADYAPVPRGDITGKVIFSIAGLGYIAAGFMDYKIFIISIVCIGFLADFVLGTESKKDRKNYENNRIESGN